MLMQLALMLAYSLPSLESCELGVCDAPVCVAPAEDVLFALAPVEIPALEDP